MWLSYLPACCTLSLCCGGEKNITEINEAGHNREQNREHRSADTEVLQEIIQNLKIAKRIALIIKGFFVHGKCSNSTVPQGLHACSTHHTYIVHWGKMLFSNHYSYWGICFCLSGNQSLEDKNAIENITFVSKHSAWWLLWITLISLIGLQFLAPV